jgi:hypothetical protein
MQQADWNRRPFAYLNGSVAGILLDGGPNRDLRWRPSGVSVVGPCADPQNAPAVGEMPSVPTAPAAIWNA